MILEQAPADPPQPIPDTGQKPPVVPVVVSAKTPESLRGQLDRVLERVDADPALTPHDLAYSLATGRAVLGHHVIVTAGDRDELRTGLRGAAALPPARRGAVGFLFTGQGAQRAGMGGQLAGAFPVFADAFDAVCAELDLHLDRPLRRVVETGDGLADTIHTQPALFAVEVALVRLLESWRVRPEYLAGHSIGELAAAHVAGVLSLPDAAALVTARGRLMQALPVGGVMVAVRAAVEDVTPLLAEHAHEVSVAAVNGPSSTVLAGDEDAVAAVVSTLAGRGHRTRRLAVSHAFHSPRMDAMLDDYRQVAESMTYHAPSIPIVSTVTGALADPTELAGPEYWVRQVRHTVRFADAVHAMTAAGVTTFVEVGPDAVLSALVGEIVPDEGSAALPTLRRDRSETHTVAALLGGLHARHLPVDWTSFFAGKASRVALPTYSFHRERYWLEPDAVTAADTLSSTRHPLLGAAVSVAGGDEVLHTSLLSARTHPWLADHVVVDTPAVPAAAFVELAIRAGDDLGTAVLDRLSLRAPLLLPPEGAVQLQVMVGAVDGTGRRPFTVHARAEHPGAPWTRHAEGQLGPDEPPTSLPQSDRVTEIRLPEALHEEAARYRLHPELLGRAVPTVVGPSTTRVPAEWRGVRLHATGATAAQVRSAASQDGALSLALHDQSDVPIATVESVTYREIENSEFFAAPPLPGAPVRGPDRPLVSSAVPVESLTDRLADLDAAGRRRLVLGTIRAEIAAVLGHGDATTVGVDRSVQDLGFDSMSAVELRNRLAAVTGIELPTTLVFEHPTTTALTDHLLELLTVGADADPVVAELDRLESALAVAQPDGEGRDAVTMRLRTILQRWIEVPPERADDDATDALENASTADIFDLIDNELGRAAR